MEDALAAKTQEVAELNQELEEIRAVFGSEGVQQVEVVLLTAFDEFRSIGLRKEV